MHWDQWLPHHLAQIPMTSCCWRDHLHQAPEAGIHYDQLSYSHCGDKLWVSTFDSEATGLALIGVDTQDPGTDTATLLLFNLIVALAFLLFLLRFFLFCFNSVALWSATGQNRLTEKPVLLDLAVHIHLALSSLRSLCCNCRLSGMGSPRVVRLAKYPSNTAIWIALSAMLFGNGRFDLSVQFQAKYSNGQQKVNVSVSKIILQWNS